MSYGLVAVDPFVICLALFCDVNLSLDLSHPVCPPTNKQLASELSQDRTTVTGNKTQSRRSHTAAARFFDKNSKDGREGSPEGIKTS